MSKPELDWQKLSEEPFRAGWRKLVKRRFKLPTGIVDDFDIYHDGDTATVIVLTSESDVLTVKHFRPGPEKIFNELVGGFIEPGEDPSVAAEREVLEETGYGGRLIFLGTSYLSAYNSGRKYIYILEDSKPIKQAQPEELEVLELEILPWSGLLEKALAGFTTDLDAVLLADRYLNQRST